MRKYKISFDACGLLVFLLVMIPNFIWCAIPAPHDILRAPSATEWIDSAASVCQIKNTWISILLDGSVPDETIISLLEFSYDSVSPKRRRKISD